jgi:hypothetical protein
VETKQTINLANLEDWFYSLKKELSEEFLFSLDSFKKLLEYDLTKLSNFKELPEEVKDIEFIIRQIINYLNTFINERSDLDLENINSKIVKFNYSHTKALSIVEDSELIKVLVDIEKNLGELKGLISYNLIKELKILSANIEKLLERVQEFDIYEGKIGQSENKIKEIESRIFHFRQKLNSLIKTRESKELDNMQFKLSKRLKELKSMEEDLNSKFRPVLKDLESFLLVGFENESLIKDYIKNPVEAIKKDFKLSIKRVLNNLYREVSTGKLKSSNKELIKELSDSLDTFVKSYNNIAREIKEIEKDIDEHPFTHKERSLTEEIKALKEVINNLEEEKQKSQDKLKALDLNKLKKEVEESLLKFLNKKISIILD